MSKFSLSIRNWYRQNKRDLPWRETSDPYFIWLSEIIMQQTRVDQGLKYYLKFTSNYPKIEDLAKAQEQDVLNDWQGLGYYSRARNLHSAAKTIIEDYKGVFPRSYDDVLKLKGVGTYTASAISSFAYGECKAVVDGNVYRLLSRAFDIDLPIDSSQGQKYFQKLADELISPQHPGEHNQAIMEVGALICSPKSPKCTQCPLESICLSREKETITERPVKSKKTKVRSRFFHFLVLSDDKNIVIQKREKKDIWQNMYQFPLIETEKKTSLEEERNWQDQTHESEIVTHILSHQKIFAVFHHIALPDKVSFNDSINIEKRNIQDYPLPRIIDKYIEDNIESL